MSVSALAPDATVAPSPDSRPDARLAEFAREAELLRPRLRAVARRIVGDSPEVEDVVQDAIVQGLHGLDRFRGDAKLSSWMHRIVTNAALMHLRRRRRQAELLVPDAGETWDVGPSQLDRGASESPERRLLEHERLERLGRALAVQPKAARELMAMCCIEERSMAEVADALGISTNAAKTRLFRTRQRLRKAMAGGRPPAR